MTTPAAILKSLNPNSQSERELGAELTHRATKMGKYSHVVHNFGNNMGIYSHVSSCMYIFPCLGITWEYITCCSQLWE